jgi:ParB/RepB/Spo0J family partition protein
MVTEQIHELGLDGITWNGNMRSSIDAARVAACAASLDLHGQLVPIRVYRNGNGYEGQDGLHRCLAAQKLGWKTIKAVIDDRTLSEADGIETQWAINCVRTEVSLLDRARSIAKQIELTKRSPSEVGKRLRLSASTITKLLVIPNLPRSILDLISVGRIGLNAAYELSKVTDLERQAELARDVANGLLTRDGVATAVKRIKRPAAKASGPAVKRAVVLLGSGRSLTVAGEQLDFESFIDSCEIALAKAKKARRQSVSFQTFLKVARDQAKG